MARFIVSRTTHGSYGPDKPCSAAFKLKHLFEPGDDDENYVWAIEAVNLQNAIVLALDGYDRAVVTHLDKHRRTIPTPYGPNYEYVVPDDIEWTVEVYDGYRE